MEPGLVSVRLSWQRQMGDGTWRRGGMDCLWSPGRYFKDKATEHKRIRKEVEDYFNFPSSL